MSLATSMLIHVVICRDLVDCEVPGGWFINRFFVHPEWTKFFCIRQQKPRGVFP